MAVTVLALVVGLSFGLFAWAANPPKPEAGAVASLRGAALSGLDLSGRDLTNVDFTGAELTNVNLVGAALSEGLVANAVWVNVKCPDGTDTGPSGGSCIGHLK